MIRVNSGGRRVVLRAKEDGREIYLEEPVRDPDGATGIVVGGTAPTAYAKNGTVNVRMDRDQTYWLYGPQVFGFEWVEEE